MRNCPQRKPTRIAALCGMVFAGMGAGCQQEGHSVFNPIHRSVARSHVSRGDQHAQRGDRQKAAQAFDRAIDADPRNADAHARLARHHAETGALELAARHYADAVKYAPDNIEYAIALARTLHRLALTDVNRESGLRAAIRAYEHARTLRPDDGAVAAGLGRCHRELGQWTAAADFLEEAAQIEPNDVHILLDLGAVTLALGELERSATACAAAIQLDPSSPDAHRGLGEACLALAYAHPDDPILRRRAAAHLRRSLELFADQPDVHQLLEQIDPNATKTISANRADSDEANVYP